MKELNLKLDDEGDLRGLISSEKLCGGSSSAEDKRD